MALLITIFCGTKKRAQTYLLSSLVSVIMVIIFSIVIHQQPYIHFPHLTLVHQPLIFTLFPLVYLLVLTAIDNDFKWSKSHVLHFAIPIFIAINLLPFYGADANNKSVSFALESQIINLPWRWQLCILCIQGFLYLLAIIRLVQNRFGSLKTAFSTPQSNFTSWTKGLVILFAILLISALLRLLSNYTIDTQWISLLMLSIVIMVIGSGYWFRRTNVDIKYAGSKLTMEQSKRHLENLVELIMREQLFKNRKLTVSHLSEVSRIPSHHISQIINQEMKMNFWDFINSYRIEEAKDLLSQEDNHKILRVAYESGFHSKSAFYAAFKKHTGLTPTQFKNGKRSPDL